MISIFEFAVIRKEYGTKGDAPRLTTLERNLNLKSQSQHTEVLNKGKYLFVNIKNYLSVILYI